jgi:hypothetical protein
MKNSGEPRFTVARLMSLVFVIFLYCGPSPLLVAQDIQKNPPAATEPGTSTTPTQDEQAGKREAWRKTMVRIESPKAGCYQASYPSTEWREVPCTTTLKRPYFPGRKQDKPVPFNVGGNTADFTLQSQGTISLAEGSFPSVNPSNLTETGNVNGNPPAQPNSFSLQINTNQYIVPGICGAFCAEAQQFIFSTNGCSAGPCVFIQVWMLGDPNPCPAGFTTSGGSDCYTDTVAMPVTGTTVTIADLAGLTLTGTATIGGGFDTVVLSTPSGMLFKGQALDAVFPGIQLGASSSWHFAEFNVFGDCCSDQAIFSTPATLVLQTSVNDGTMNPPTCLNQSFTAETNNLNLSDVTNTTTLVCCAYGGTTPNIQFMETNATPPHTAICGATHLIGDPHITTVDGTHFDFQSAGEFVSLRDRSGDEIQTRQTPVSTTFIGTDGYDGLTTCVSLNTAVAARVGEHRVTYEPNLDGVPDPSGLQLRIDGALTTLGSQGRDLGNGGRVFHTPTSGNLEIDFPDGKTLFVTPGWWASQGEWYLNVDVTHLGLVSAVGQASERGIAGPIATESWLPALPNGTSLGPMPGSLQQRYVDLYRRFADAWRVTNKDSLFDYEPGTSTATFTMKEWPPQKSPCIVPNAKPVEPGSAEVAAAVCRRVRDPKMRADCTFDVIATGNLGAAKTYLAGERTLADATTLSLAQDPETSQAGEWVTFTAYVAANSVDVKGYPSGTVQFAVDGANVGEPVIVDAKGRATWQTSQLKVGSHRVTASYLPGSDSLFLPSSTVEKTHVVKRCHCDAEAQHK